MLARSQTTILLQIFSELTLYSKVNSKSIKVADDTFQSNSKCEWVKVSLVRDIESERVYLEIFEYWLWLKTNTLSQLNIYQVFVSNGFNSYTVFSCLHRRNLPSFWSEK